MPQSPDLLMFCLMKTSDGTSVRAQHWAYLFRCFPLLFHHQESLDLQPRFLVRHLLQQLPATNKRRSSVNHAFGEIWPSALLVLAA
jgi:hypothetical protein